MLSANFLADFSSFLDATRESVQAMQGFKESAEELGPAADRGLADVEKQWEQVGRQVRRVGEDTLAAANTFIQAYAEEEEATARLNAALDATGHSTEGVKQKYADLAESFQKTTRYSDDAIISAEAVLTTIGKVGPEQMELALTAVTNLASGMKIDLGQAATLVAKGFASGGENLGKLKTVMGETSKDIKSSTDLLNALNQQFAGQAEADVKTYAGSMENLNNKLENTKGIVGEQLIGALRSMLEVFQSLPAPVQTLSVGIVAIGTALAPVLVSLASLVSILSAPAIGAGLIGAFEAILPFLGPAGWIAAGVIAVVAVWKNWDTIVGFISNIYNALKTYLVDGFNSILGKIGASVDWVANKFKWLKDVVVSHSYVPDMIAEIGQNFDQLDRVMVKPAEASLSYVANLFKKYTAMMSGNTAIGSISSGAKDKDFMSWAMGMVPGLTPGDVLSGLRAGGAVGAGFSGAAAAPIQNTFNIVDTESEIARRVAEVINRQVRAGSLVN